MIRRLSPVALLARALALVLALGALAAATAPAAAQDGYYRRYYDAPARSYERSYDRYYDQDRMIQERTEYYRREALARREADRRRAASDAARYARERESGPNFLQRLFGGGRSRDVEVDDGWTARRDPGAVEVRPKPRVRRKPAEPTPTPLPPVATPGEPAAAPTTFVAVIGDSVADGLASGLQEAFADTPDVAVKRYARANAGLVRADYHDFAEAARKALEEGPVAYAVIDVGVNDRQPFLDMRDAAPLSPGWRARYLARVDAVLAPFKAKSVPVYWVGLAPSSSARANSDLIALNAMVKERVQAAGGTFVDVWEGFVDDNGDYAAIGPQLDGQIARLRLDDGVHFSKAGARKLAHYVEQEIRKAYRPKPADALIGALPDGAAGDPNASPLVDRPRPLAGPVVVLTAPRRSEGGALVGGAPKAGARPDTAERLLVRGEALDADPGRLDDHRWPGAEAAKADPAKPDAAAEAAAPKP